MHSNTIRNPPPDRPLDRTDVEILALLQKDARLSNKELAGKVGLSPSTVLGRVRRLVERGALRGFHAELDPAQVGVGLQGLVMVRLRQHSRGLVESFRDHLLNLPEVVQAFHVSGRFDYMVHVAVRDAEHLRDLAMDELTTRAEVAHIETSLAFEHVRAGGLPIYARGLMESPG